MPTVSREELYRQALLDVKVDQGTPYDISQEDLDALRTPPNRNCGPFISQREATQEILDHNRVGRDVSSAELAAIQRLREALANSRWNPDIVIKAFQDLDLIFFCGRLRHKVGFQWQSSSAFAPYERPGRLYLGATFRTEAIGQMSIMLNAHHLLFRDIIQNPWMLMWATALHEMCHAYEGVRAREGMQPGHEANFELKIQAVHDRAQRLFDLWAIVPAEEFQRCGLKYPGTVKRAASCTVQ